MKDIYSISFLVLSTIFQSSASAEDAPETTTENIQEADIYMEEIRATCQAEAVGMENAEAYVSECINSMKQGFTGSN